MNQLNTAFWACLIVANIWMAAGDRLQACIWTALSTLAWIAGRRWSGLAGFWSKVWSR
ncbi:hypothetical protein [uncultured Ramlibacter sp.]|uniref:hypothetical protein n=1 Tax=uncultured Ramlibacter sp. TaxID=260755 RepID=UPI00260D1E60|nr:hypothetical protein [uncultured Ramlibacter sp.]